MNQSSLRLLAESNNERGDLLTRLSKDLFFSLGYDKLELDVALPGRELDLQGEHRFESRRVLAECKAHATPIGGADLNKFLGVLTRERTKHAPKPIAGYFVSLSGFTGTAEEQERASGDEGVLLLDAARVALELQAGHAVIPLVRAAERAGQCAQYSGISTSELAEIELVGHAIGYLWIAYYAKDKATSHFAIVHADGTPLAPSIAADVVRCDNAVGGRLAGLTYLTPPSSPADAAAAANRALAQYKQWLGEECGYIQLDGLPADSDLSATKLRLEKLFVPLKALVDRRDKAGAAPGIVADEQPAISIGRLITDTPHLALLAAPGGGKSTLLKRLATAYAFPERRREVADDLPDRSWLPIYVRCRDLRDRAHRPLLELLHGIAAHANMDDRTAEAFRQAISASLRTGGALLLVDGLDEISEEPDRRAFAANLRTFMAMFPQVALVVTSRVAGFREVATVIASTCQSARLAPLDAVDVRRLCESWHVEVVADTERVRADARHLGDQIWSNLHIRTLVENPLLLTTLLVVKRSNGEIPPSRADLYHEAVRVLVRTWNVEGYAPLDERETLARLCFVACAMMQAGTQVIGQEDLVRLLREASRELDAELQFARVSPAEFISRIEYRSSLLMQTGYQRFDGVLQPVFEFRHLTFQEYLAARGFVQELYPGRSDERTLVELLRPQFENEGWQEVIPLVAALAGRKADKLVRELVRVSVAARDAVQARGGSLLAADSASLPPGYLLARCVAEEVTIDPSTLRDALREVARVAGSDTWSHWRDQMLPYLHAISDGRFGATLEEVARDAFLSDGDWAVFDWPLSEVLWVRRVRSTAVQVDRELVQRLIAELSSDSRGVRICAALLFMRAAYEVHNSPLQATALFGADGEAARLRLAELLSLGDPPAALSAAWALAWLAASDAVGPAAPWSLLSELYRCWREGQSQELGRMGAWALAMQPLNARGSAPQGLWGEDCDQWLLSEWEHESGTIATDRAVAALVVGWYRRSPWGDEELVARILTYSQGAGIFERTLKALLGTLGAAGDAALQSFVVRGQAKRRKPRHRERQ